MKVPFQRATADEELAKISLFMLKHKSDFNPAFTTLDMLEQLYTNMTQGYLHYAMTEEGRVVVAGAYYHGTPEKQFADRHVVFIDYVILDPAYRGTTLFLQSLQHIVGWVREAHPEATELRLKAMSDNLRVCRLYGKFVQPSYKEDTPYGEMTVFCEKINQIVAILKKFDRL